MLNFDKYLFRCSALGHIMAGKEGLGDTAKSYLLRIYIKEKYGRAKNISNMYIEKGLLCEGQSITLLSFVDDKLYVKNKKRFRNEFIQGEPDIITEETVDDVKTNWDIFTFFDADLSDLYEWQLRAYMWLTGKRKARLRYCLVNTPEHLIEREESKTFFQMGVRDRDDTDYLLACAEIRRYSLFDDIPQAKRVRTFWIEHSEEKIKILQARILECRKYLNFLAAQDL